MGSSFEVLYLVNRFVRGHLAKKKVGIVHGTRATNAQLPSFLKRKTTDWDVFVKFPELRARQLENLLDKRFRGDFFKVKKGSGSPGIKVFKVKSTVTGEGLVDFATPNRQIPFVAKRGVKFATLADQKNIALQNLNKPSARFRRPKDLNLLRRIRIFEELRGRKIKGTNMDHFKSGQHYY